MPDPVPQEFAVALRQTAGRRGRFGEPLFYFDEIGSTNDEAARLAEAGAAEGTTVVAASQTAGRGRLGRSWYSPPGAGLYVSVVVRDRRVAPFVTLAGGVAVAEGIIRAAGLPVEIKWPNDVVVDAGRGPRRKVAGILAEAATSAAGMQYVVLGFGVNLGAAAYPPEIADRAASLETELGRAVDAGAVLAECLAALAEHVAVVAAGESRRLLARWTALSPSAVGTRVEWEEAGGARAGRTAGIAEDGALLVRVGAATERIISGTLRWG
ncbi:MAG TPA: biotin--[acetyl-CoA-carboxylase] ligase [Vicinamibacterales bacterium]|nr:biotin--[acetyl-CoA-carboxylase] ligase [Vicinamibacterales bacterium]